MDKKFYQNDFLKKVIKPKTSIISDSLENKLGFHPIVIITNEYGDVYYLKVRSYNQQNHKKEEVLIQPNQVLKHLSVVDTRKVYMMKEDEFIKYFNDGLILKSQHLKLNELFKIYDRLYQNLINKPPYISLIGINYVNQKNTIPYTIYSHQDILEDDLFAIKNNPYLVNEIKKYESLIKTILEERNKNDDHLNLVENLKKYVEESLIQTNILLKQSKSKEKEEY